MKDYSLLFSADKAANTVGHYDAYKKRKDLEDIDSELPIMLSVISPESLINIMNAFYFVSMVLNILVYMLLDQASILSIEFAGSFTFFKRQIRFAVVPEDNRVEITKRSSSFFI